MQRWYLYLVRCGDGTLYTGISTDVDRRLAEHSAGKGARYLKAGPPRPGPQGPRRRVGDALKVERKVKRMSPARKEKLILGKVLLKDLLKAKPPAVVLKRKKVKGKRKK